jgi:hypothetical protein
MTVNLLYDVIFKCVTFAFRANQTFERLFTLISHFADVTVNGVETFKQRHVLFKVLEVFSHPAKTLPNEASKTTNYSEDNIESNATVFLRATDISKLKASLEQWAAVVPDIIVTVLNCF